LSLVVRYNAPAPFESGDVEHPGRFVPCDNESAALELSRAVKHGCATSEPVPVATQLLGLKREDVVKSSVNFPGAAWAGTVVVTVLTRVAKRVITRMRAILFTGGAPTR
jgi:hypothetical protein